MGPFSGFVKSMPNCIYRTNFSFVIYKFWFKQMKKGLNRCAALIVTVYNKHDSDCLETLET